MSLPFRTPMFVASLGLISLAAACGRPDAGPSTPLNAPAGRADLMPQESGTRYIVQLADGATLSDAALRASGGSVVDAVPVVNAVVVEGVSDASALSADPSVRSVLPDLRVQLMSAGEETMGEAALAPMYTDGTQWDMKAMHADEAWAATKGGAGARACIIDSGIDQTHPELAGKVDRDTSFLPNANGKDQIVAIDSLGHGTHVAGTITGNGVKMASVAPNARLMIAKVFDGAGGSATTSRVWNAMVWCADNGADVANMSLGFTNGISRAANAAFIAQYQIIADYMRESGTLLVASAGNDDFKLPNATNMWLPAELDNVLSVGASAPVTDRRIGGGWPNVIGGTYDRKAFYSNYGTGVDVFAPGGRGSIPLWFIPRGQGSTYDAIVGPCAAKSISPLGPTIPSKNGPGSAGPCSAGGQYMWIQGTSMASPHVVGMAAVLRGEIAEPRSAAVANRIEACIQQSTDNVGPSTTFGKGRVNVMTAVNRLRAGQC